MSRNFLLFLAFFGPVTPGPLWSQGDLLPPEKAAENLQLPPGFQATLFAGEPAIVQPMAFTFDDRGRVWVVECLSYPTWKADGTGNDRVTILEDTDGDGRHDKRTVFLDNGVNLSGIEVGFGGVWLTSAPNFIFIPDANGDDKPDGPAKILLEGWTLDAKHNVVGNLAWGPDGWLYGCNGITAPSFVGKPGTPPEQRQKVSCGVWRYHPVRHEWEVYANGTTNPWGIDWDERGQMFITNCVIKHIFHVVPGAHFVRMFGQDPNPHVYGLIESCADHQHWAGGHWTTARGGEAHHDAGGGHAHSGCMIYLGDNWPAEYRNNAFLLNIHGQRLNRDKLERHGSSYVAKHAPDMIFSKDPWFRGLHAKYGPDGGVYISDWSDTGECHDAKEEECDKTGGRILKVVYGDKPTIRPAGNAFRGVQQSFNLQKLLDIELIELQAHTNEWFVRHSRRLLHERAAAGKLNRELLHEVFRDALPQPNASTILNQRFEANYLRNLFTLHVTDQLDDKTLLAALDTDVEILRAQAVTLAVETPRASVIRKLRRLAVIDRSPFVRLHIASALQQIPLEDRWPIAEALLAHTEDASDHYLPLMYWYAVEPLVPHDVNRAIELLPQIKIPLVRQYLTRRILAHHEEQHKASPGSSKAIEIIVTLAAKTGDTVLQGDILRGLCEAFAGRTIVPEPRSWSAAYELFSASTDARVKDAAQELAVLFGDVFVLSALTKRLMEPSASLQDKRRALALLHQRRDPFAAKFALSSVAGGPGSLREESIRYLGAYDDHLIPDVLVANYADFITSEKADIIQTLTARPSFALALLSAIEAGTIPRQDVSALVIRQLQALENAQVGDRLKQVWGDIRRPSAEKKQRIEQLKSQLTADALQSADLPRGRALYAKSCATCHKLFDEGAKIGPELTGSQRTSLDYILDNVLDPSSLVPREYKVNILRLADGRVLQGVILEETPHAVAVQTPSEIVRVPLSDIEARKESSVSMMPEGLFDRLDAAELRDLVAYLASPRQIPLPAGPNAQGP